MRELEVLSEFCWTGGSRGRRGFARWCAGLAVVRFERDADAVGLAGEVLVVDVVTAVVASRTSIEIRALVEGESATRSHRYAWSWFGACIALPLSCRRSKDTSSAFAVRESTVGVDTILALLNPVSNVSTVGEADSISCR